MIAVCRQSEIQFAKLAVVIGIMVFCSLGCASGDSYRRRPVMVKKLFPSQASDWEKVIKNSYPSWKKPTVTVTSYNRAKHRRVAKYSHKQPWGTHTSGSSSTKPGNIRASSSGKGSPRLTQTNRSYTTYFKYEPKRTLPNAIIDRGDYLPPAAIQDYKIVPVETIVPLSAKQSSRDGRIRYEVSKGETLMQISRKFYGDESGWKRIFKVNRDMITSPDHIKPGMTIIIP